MPDEFKCEFPSFNATAAEIKALLESAKTIAVVGISPKPDRPSHGIALYLMQNGYTVFGVNPGISTFEGEKVYKSLLEIPEPVDIVDIFRRSEEVPPHVEDAIKIKAKAIWMQEGIVNNAAAKRAKEAGLIVVMNRCIYRDHLGISV